MDDFQIHPRGGESVQFAVKCSLVPDKENFGSGLAGGLNRSGDDHGRTEIASMASTAITVLLLLIGGLLLDDLTTAVGAAAGAGSVGNRGGSAGAVHNGGGGHAIVGPAHTLLGMRLLILLYGHDGTP